MIVRPPEWWSELARVPYRELLNSPGIARAHDFQRIASYGLGVLIALLVEMPAWRSAAVLAITGAQLLAALERLVTQRRVSPYLLAQLDQVLASIGVALATASPLITFGVVAFISAAITASFAAPPRVAAIAAVATGTPAVVTAVAIASPEAAGNDYLAALVLIVLLLALASFILVFFTLQARQLRRELSSREIQLGAVLEVTPVVLATVDHSGAVTTLAGDLPGWKELATRGLAAESDLNQLVNRAAAGEQAQGEVSFGGQTFTVSCNPGNNGKALLTAYDVSEQAEARQRLEELVRAKDQFIAAVSHELRTPLSAVLGFAEVVRNTMAADDPLQPMIGEVADQSAEMAAIIDDLLIAARSSLESVPTAPRAIDLAAEAAAVADAIGARLSRAPLFETEATPTYADPIRVRQIIRNLLTNADRYGGDEVRVRTGTNGTSAVLQVCDNGTPLSAELQERIFEPYESSGPVRGQPAAIGLGLSVSRTLAELMGGSIRYDHDGRWSIFELQLPKNGDLRPTGQTTD